MSNLSKNIKYLRKLNHWNQTELAEQLGVKRGSIASYESKNVEPRLSLIVKIAKLFDVRLLDLIEMDLSEINGQYRSFNSKSSNPYDNTVTIKEMLDTANSEDYTNFLEKSERMQTMIDGFRIFYRMKLQTYRDNPQEMDSANNIIGDLENFVLLLDKIGQTNQILFEQSISLSEDDTTSKTSSER